MRQVRLTPPHRAVQDRLWWQRETGQLGAGSKAFEGPLAGVGSMGVFIEQMAALRPSDGARREPRMLGLDGPWERMVSEGHGSVRLPAMEGECEDSVLGSSWGHLGELRPAGCIVAGILAPQTLALQDG